MEVLEEKGLKGAMRSLGVRHGMHKTSIRLTPLNIFAQLLTSEKPEKKQEIAADGLFPKASVFDESITASPGAPDPTVRQNRLTTKAGKSSPKRARSIERS